MLVPLGYEWAVFESPKTILVFDIMMGITMVVTVATGIDYLVRHGALLKNVIR